MDKVLSGPVSLYLAGFNPAIFGMNELLQLLAPYGTVVSVKVHLSQPGKKGVIHILHLSFCIKLFCAVFANTPDSLEFRSYRALEREREEAARKRENVKTEP